MKHIKFLISLFLIVFVVVGCKESGNNPNDPTNQNNEQDSEHILQITPISFEKIDSYKNYKTGEFDVEGCKKYLEECGLEIEVDEYEEESDYHQIYASMDCTYATIYYGVIENEENVVLSSVSIQSTENGFHVVISICDDAGFTNHIEYMENGNIKYFTPFSNADLLAVYRKDLTYMQTRKKEILPNISGGSKEEYFGLDLFLESETRDYNYNSYEELLTAIDNYSFSNTTNQSYTCSDEDAMFSGESLTGYYVIDESEELPLTCYFNVILSKNGFKSYSMQYHFFNLD